MTSLQPPPAGASLSRKSARSAKVTVYHTTGPSAYKSPILDEDGSGKPALNPRSCITCRRRKVRCDKQMPCANCRRTLIPCTYPEPGRAPRSLNPKNPTPREIELSHEVRKLREIITDLTGQTFSDATGNLTSQAGLAYLDQDRQFSSQNTYLGPENPSSGGTSFAVHSRISSEEGVDTRAELGNTLGDPDDHAKYVSRGFWSGLYSELDSIRNETPEIDEEDDLESEYEDTPSYASPIGNTTTTNDHHAFVMGYQSTSVELRQFYPQPTHATFLWSTYQDKVEPLIKLLHIPTANILMREARQAPEMLSPGQESLVLAVYFAGLTALEPDEVQAHLGTTKDVLLSQYRFAVEQALAKAKFLDPDDFKVVQAFALFLIVVRRHDDSQFCWTLSSLLVRIAQGLRIHRDGIVLKLSPFETEMRRRLWWNILVLDYRSAEELGTDMCVGEHTFDTQIPSNVNDSDLTLNSTEPVGSREGKTDCTIFLARVEICALSRRLVFATSKIASYSSTVNESNIAEREHLLVEVSRFTEQKFVRHVMDETDDLYWNARMMSNVIKSKMCLVVYQPMLLPGHKYKLSNEIRQRLYVAAIEVSEYNQTMTRDPRGRRYRWVCQTYINWHSVAFALIETCRRPWTALVERAWRVLETFEAVSRENTGRANNAAVFLPLRRLLARARKHRETEIERLKNNPEEANRLDILELNNLSSSSRGRFASVIGIDDKMEEVRKDWREMMQLSELSPQQYSTESYLTQEQGKPNSSASTTKPTQMPDSIRKEATVQVTMGGMVQESLQAFNAPSCNHNWSGSNGFNNAADAAMVNPLTNAQQTWVTDNFPVQTDQLHTGSLWETMLPISDVQAGNGNIMAEDDILGDGFNWQDWSMRAMDTGYA